VRGSVADRKSGCASLSVRYGPGCWRFHVRPPAPASRPRVSVAADAGGNYYLAAAAQLNCPCKFALAMFERGC